MKRTWIPLLSLLLATAVVADHHIPGEVTGGIDCTDALNQVIYPECQVTSVEPEPESETSCVATYHPDEGNLEIAWVDVAGEGYSGVVLGSLSAADFTFQLSAAEPATGDAPAVECQASFDVAAGVVTVPRVDMHDASGAVSASFANVLLQLTDPATLTFQVSGAEPVQ